MELQINSTQSQYIHGSEGENSCAECNEKATVVDYMYGPPGKKLCNDCYKIKANKRMYG